MGRTRTFHPDLQATLPLATADVHAPAANTAAVVTYAAITASSGTPGVQNQPVPASYINPANNPQNTSHVIAGFVASCVADSVLAAASAPRVTIEDGSGNVAFTVSLPLVTASEASAAGKATYYLDFRFPVPVRGTAGRALIITVPANGANTVNKLSVLGHTTQVA